MRLIPILSMAALLLSCNSKNQKVGLSHSDVSADSCYHTKIQLLLQPEQMRIAADKYAIGSNDTSTIFSPSYYSTPMIFNHSVRYHSLKVPSKTQYGFTYNGIKLFLNAATHLEFTEFGAKPIQFQLTGKSCIETTSDSAIIDAGDAIIYLDRRTKINILNYPDEPIAIISLIKGSAVVSKYNSAIDMSAGKEVLVNRNSGEITSQDGDTSETVGWLGGWTRLHDTDIACVFRDIARWYEKRIVYPDGYLGGSIVLFNYRTTHIDSALKDFNNANIDRNIQFTKNGDNIYIAKKNRRINL